jgi:hypothetical protein
MRTAAEYLQKRPHARPTTIAHRAKVAATVEQLKRELEATGMAAEPERKSMIERFMPWFRRRT